MRRVALPGVGIDTTALGFGCNTLLGDRTREQGLESLCAAFDSGIRHFDVAPSYGQGMAEAIVGEFAQGRRDAMVITTKFGLEPSLPAAARSGFIRQVVRRVMRISPGIRRALGRASSATLKKGMFQPEFAQSSVERSLRLLRTDRIDILFLHACEPGDLADSDRLLDTLNSMKRAGKIRAFGIGTSVPATTEICRQHPAFGEVTQFASSVLISSIETVRPRGAVITHGALSGSFAALRTHLASQPELAQRWSKALDADCSDSAILAALLLAYAARANLQGSVIFSSTSPSRIRANARSFEERSFADAQLDLLRTLALESGVQPL